MTTKHVTKGISTKVGGSGVTFAALNLLYWGMFTTEWWPTIEPAPPTEVWQWFTLLVTVGAGYFIPELATSEDLPPA